MEGFVEIDRVETRNQSTGITRRKQCIECAWILIMLLIMIVLMEIICFI